ncbi:hydantoinase B/oxoprolinase family protein [Rhodopila sp.]|jgi:N-methylhydantoinase B|uniref:hydantoinase B/oxoprolinase family protein n=1 Tax=Rhodopila sp. TaxID=2480087 RepID=UPI002B534E4E|nr:hydantoinase B/oxoprolinase family protein [Rhodopila sp.]HVZ08842.1 hydantoinase B/oxoprolinase family protein [Rhodopila sp.]
MTDPITIAVLQNRLNAIAEEMGEAMLRTAYSQILNSSRDFSIALVDAQCRLVAQADHIPVHVGAMAWAVKALAARFPDPRPGDVYLLNDPYRGGSHLPDLTVFVPVFADGALMFWSVVRAHHSDIGGATHGAYNPAATEIWHEGLRLPPVRLTENGVLREDLLEMLALNVRHPRDFRGDLAAQIGSARLGEVRLSSVIAEFGAATLSASIEAMLDATERYSRDIVAGWADGVYYGEAVLDDDGFDRKDIVIRARVTKAGSDVTVDLTESDPQVTGFINSSHANTQSAVAIAFAFLLDPDITKNEGAFRPLTVKLKEGTIVWAREGAPVTMCTSHCSNEVIEAIIVALSQACPERAMGGWGRRLRIALNGTDPRTGRRFIWHMFQARPGGGGSVAGDGYSTIGEWHSAGGIKFGSIEVAETRFPLVFETHEYRRGSAGDGQFRGGYGGDMRLRIEAAGTTMANTAGEGVVHGARGMCGGCDGTPHDYTLLAPNAEPRKLKSKEVNVPVPTGSVIHVLSGGGGGWGDPASRDDAARAADAKAGLA